VATDELHPLDHPSPLRRELAIPPDKVVALYAGNMSEKQGLEMLVVAARALADDGDISFVFAGEGAARRRLETMSLGLGNVTFLPLQPAERLNDLLNLADIHLLPQRRGVADLVMPSKLLGMMSSGRPVVAGADPGSALGNVVASCGLVVTPEDGAAMAASVRVLAGDGARRVVAEWSRDAVLGDFLRRLADMLPRRQAAQTGVLSRVAGPSD
jgi:colanic acid biosynthesis glycosyl transferase WcaI